MLHDTCKLTEEGVCVCVCVCGGNIIFTTHGIHPLLEVWVFGCTILDYLFV